MKFSDGIFYRVFDSVAKEYPQIKNEHYILISVHKTRNAAKLDATAETSGSVRQDLLILGLDMLFEAVHGSAPDIAGKNIANPSGLLNATVMMLVRIGKETTAALIENAWKKTGYL